LGGSGYIKLLEIRTGSAAMRLFTFQTDSDMLFPKKAQTFIPLGKRFLNEYILTDQPISLINNHDFISSLTVSLIYNVTW